MAITAEANTLMLSAAITASLDSITVVALINSMGEYLRKDYESVSKLTVSKYQYVFYFSELEGNDTIVGVQLSGDGATTTLFSGTNFAYQGLATSIVKTFTQSLTIVWTVELV